MTLRELLAGAGLPSTAGGDITVSGVTYDSRRVERGSVFVAISGFQSDGHRYAASAVDAGAVAVVAERPPQPSLPQDTPLILVADARLALADLAAAAVRHPSRQLTVIGVTGTDGKTTTSTMLWAALLEDGGKPGCLTTVDIRIGHEISDNTTRQTTQEAVELQQHLRFMVDRGCTSAVVETSSHALQLRRADSVDYRGAVFTRVTSEHLELHGTRQAYLEAKARLIELAARHQQSFAVLDADDDFGYPVLRQRPIAERYSYSATGGSADLRATEIVADLSGVRFTALTPWGSAELRLRLAGRFNVSNALAALAAACAVGTPLEVAARGISGLDRVFGRMESVSLGQPFSVVIDYAHTAEALAQALTELRPITAGRLWVVFGSAGERDHEKRPAMGRVGAQLADICVITDEDPREEDRHAILEEIAAGAYDAGGRPGDTVRIVADRVAAVELAIAAAQPGDTVLLAGKGHESCIIMGREKVPYSEHDVAEAALQRCLGRRTQ